MPAIMQYYAYLIYLSINCHCQEQRQIANMEDEREEKQTVSDSQLQSEVAARRTEVAGLLSRKNKSGALIAALTNPPVQTKNNDIKVLVPSS
jgi:hypothetical protein